MVTLTDYALRFLNSSHEDKLKSRVVTSCGVERMMGDQTRTVSTCGGVEGTTLSRGKMEVGRRDALNLPREFGWKS
jgi:hypothetical protein